MRSQFLLFVASALGIVFSGFAQTTYQLPPKEILELADTKAPSSNLISPKNSYLVQLDRPLYKSLEELAEPELKLAGLRFNPRNFNQSRGTWYSAIKLLTLPDAKEKTVTGLPANARFQSFSFSPDETHLAFVEIGSSQLKLWLLNMKTGQAKPTAATDLNAVMGGAYSWSSDGKSLYVKLRGGKTSLPETQELPKGPATQDASGVKAPARTYQDLLRNKQDEARFDHYAGATVVRIRVSSPETTEPFLPQGIYKRMSPSPDASTVLVEEVVQPYSYTLPYSFFASRFDLVSADGKTRTTFYNRPLQDKTPVDFDAVEAGKRNISWRDDEPATLIWAEAPDGGDPKKPSDFRDQLFQARAPYKEAKSMCMLKNRMEGIYFGKQDVAIVVDGWWKNRNTRTYLINPGAENQNPKVLFDRSSEDEYGNPGSFVTEENAFHQEVLRFSKDGKKLYLQGEGCSPAGNRPFLDEFDLASGKTKRLWQADGATTYETPVRVIDWEKKIMITSIQSPKMMPNLYFRTWTSKAAPRQFTFRPNPYASLSGVSKQKIFYKRKDGVELSATLYLPAGYDKAKSGRLPLLMEAYPTEFKDDKAAGQVTESPHMFIAINWASPVFWVNRGFAVLEDAKFPIIGKGDQEPNDTYIEQLVADAEAAIRYLDSAGIADKNRCAVMGHSYGAFMTANLLCHSNLFAAGIARSGAYNRSLTPFGFQSEERTYWQATKVYQDMSPFNFADKFTNPILMIHGDADNNPGTFTLQSERLFQAIKGNGGKARLVLLPMESHGYAARENIMHMLWEMDTWLDKWVKNKP